MKSACLAEYRHLSNKGAWAFMNTTALRLGLFLAMIGFSSPRLCANVNITSPTGGNNISADKALNSSASDSTATLPPAAAVAGGTTNLKASFNATGNCLKPSRAFFLSLPDLVHFLRLTAEVSILRLTAGSLKAVHFCLIWCNPAVNRRKPQTSFGPIPAINGRKSQSSK